MIVQQLAKLSLLLMAASVVWLQSLPQAFATDGKSPPPIVLLKQEKHKELDKFLLGKQRAFEAGEIQPGAVYSQFSFTTGSEPWLEAHLNTWLKSAPESYAAHFARGQYYVSRGWLVRGDRYIDQTPPENIREMSRFMKLAVVDLKKSISLTAKPLISYSLLMNAGMSMGWKEQNRQWLDEANRIDPGNIYVKVDYLLTLRPRWGGSFEEMQSFVDESKKLLKRQEDINLLQSHVWRSQAYVRWHDYKDYQGGVDGYTKAIELHNKDMTPYVRRAYCYHMLEQYEQALRDYNHAISVAPRYQLAYRGRGVTLRQLKRDDEAIADLIRATKLNPDDGAAWRLLGYSYFASNKFDKAFVCYQKGAERGNADAQQGLGFLYWEGKGVEKNRDKAIHWWTIAAKNGNAQAIHDLRVEGKLP